MLSDFSSSFFSSGSVALVWRTILSIAICIFRFPLFSAAANKFAAFATYVRRTGLHWMGRHRKLESIGDFAKLSEIDKFQLRCLAVNGAAERRQKQNRDKWNETVEKERNEKFHRVNC